MNCGLEEGKRRWDRAEGRQDVGWGNCPELGW